MKRLIAILLSLLTLMGCLSVGVFAADDPADPADPEIVKTDSGYYVGQIFKPGDAITSIYEECETLTVQYSVGIDDVEHVTSEMQQKYADPEFAGVVSFRDTIPSFTSGDAYKGSYPVAKVGSKVSEMEVRNGEFKLANDIYKDLDEKVRKKMKDGLTLTVDYEYEKSTLKQYTTLTGWEIIRVTESKSALSLQLQAVFETREPTGSEKVLEKMYENWLAFLDKLGDFLIPIVPKVFDLWAKLLGKRG